MHACLSSSSPLGQSMKPSQRTWSSIQRYRPVRSGVGHANLSMPSSSAGGHSVTHDVTLIFCEIRSTQWAVYYGSRRGWTYSGAAPCGQAVRHPFHAVPGHCACNMFYKTQVLPNPFISLVKPIQRYHSFRSGVEKSNAPDCYAILPIPVDTMQLNNVVQL